MKEQCVATQSDPESVWTRDHDPNIKLIINTFYGLHIMLAIKLDIYCVTGLAEESFLNVLFSQLPFKTLLNVLTFS